MWADLQPCIRFEYPWRPIFLHAKDAVWDGGSLTAQSIESQQKMRLALLEQKASHHAPARMGGRDTSSALR